MKSKKINIEKFFNGVLNQKHTELEIINTVEVITDKDPDKLESFLKDFRSFVKSKKEEEKSEWQVSESESKRLQYNKENYPETILVHHDGTPVEKEPYMIKATDYTGSEKFIEFLRKIIKDSKSKKTKSEKLTKKLNNYGFAKLEMVASLSKNAKNKLLNILVLHKLPYNIAMLNYLGFLDFVKKEYCDSYDNRLHKKIAKILEKDERSVRGNTNVLNSNSKESRSQYTAHLHEEEVKRDYELLK